MKANNLVLGSKFVWNWMIFSLVMLIITLILSMSLTEKISYFAFSTNLLYVVIFGFVIIKTYGISNYHFFTRRRLLFTVAGISILFLFLHSLLFYWHTDSFWEFSARDSLEYDILAKNMNHYGIIEGVIKYLANGQDFEDLGAVFFTSLAYRIYPSPLMFNIFNVLVGVIVVNSIFNISSFYMNRKYAYLTALTYGLSSYVIYLYATGMKETFFVLFVILFYDNLLKFVKNKKSSDLILSLLSAFLIIFFRPAVLGMMGMGVIGAVIFGKKQGFVSFLIFIIFVLSFIFLSQKVVEIKDRYYGSPELVSYRAKQYSHIEANSFTYASSFFSGFFGPLPTYTPIFGRLQQSFYSVGLGFRVFISLFFFLGLIQSIKERDFVIMSLGLFAIIEILSLSIILEVFELRLDSPHMPALYIVAFYYVTSLKYNSIRKIKRLKKIVFLYSFVFGILILLWNLRFLLNFQ